MNHVAKHAPAAHVQQFVIRGDRLKTTQSTFRRTKLLKKPDPSLAANDMFGAPRENPVTMMKARHPRQLGSPRA